MTHTKEWNKLPETIFFMQPKESKYHKILTVGEPGLLRTGNANEKITKYTVAAIACYILYRVITSANPQIETPAQEPAPLQPEEGPKYQIPRDARTA